MGLNCSQKSLIIPTRIRMSLMNVINASTESPEFLALRRCEQGPKPSRDRGNGARWSESHPRADESCEVFDSREKPRKTSGIIVGFSNPGVSLRGD